jgi:hypothetical protein
MYRPLVTSDAVLAKLVRGAIETREHPMIEERDEAVAELALGLEEIVRKRLSEKGAWDPRYVSLDGIQTHRVETDGSTRSGSSGRSTYSTSTGTGCSQWMPIFRSSRVQSQRSRSLTPRASSICRLANDGSSPRSNKPRGSTPSASRSHKRLLVRSSSMATALSPTDYASTICAASPVD